MKIRKAPSNIPELGERCKLRGRPASGVVEKIIREWQWAIVKWDEGITAPRIVHHHELERVSLAQSPEQI